MLVGLLGQARWKLKSAQIIGNLKKIFFKEPLQRPTPASPASDQFPDSFRISSSDHGRSHERGPCACPPSLPPTAVAAAPLS